MRFILLTLLLMSFLWGSRICAQELTPVFENITEGLPSTEVHDIFQDSVGYMWFATDRGICRYNGDKIKIIDTDKDINTNVFFKFFKQTETKVWLLTDNFTLFCFNPFDAHPTFRSHPKNSQIQSKLLSTCHMNNLSNALFSGDDIMLLFRRAPGYLHIPKTGMCKWYYPQEDVCDSLEFNTQLEIKREGQIYFTQFNKSSTPNSITSLKIGSKIIKTDDFIHFFKAQDFGISSHLETKHGTYLSISEQLIRIHNNKVSHIKLPNKILCSLESNNKIYVGTYEGIFVFDYNLNLTGHFLKEKCVTKIFEDKNQNFWVSTIQSGVYVTNDQKVNELKLDFSFNNSDFMLSGQSLILFDDVKLECLIIDQNLKLLKRAKETIILGSRLSSDNHEILPFTENLIPYKWKSNSNSNLKWKYSFFSSKDVTTFFLARGVVYRFEHGYLSAFHKNNENTDLTFCIESNDSILLLGSKKGLYTLNTKTNIRSKNPIKGTENTRFNSVANLSGEIILATDKGIYCYSKNKLKYINRSEQCRTKFIYKRNEVSAWLWNDNAVYQLNLKDGKITISPEKIYYTKLNATIRTLIEFENKLWISTNKGTQLIDIESYQLSNEKVKYTFIIDSLLINYEKLGDLSKIHIREGNTLSLFFSSICFDRGINNQLEYSIDGITWFETNKNSIVVSSFQSGDYILRIRKIDEPSNILFSIPIHVSRVWYQSYWFVILCSLIILSLVVLLIFRFFKARDKKRSSELEKVNLELKLLTSKMNPHFTFNTINSIQYYILNSERKEAIQYLSDFALLIRKSLEFSMTERISIEEEIHFLSLYVKLENKRFDSNFHLQFDCEPKNILHRKIPSMVIQPLVENIILHAGYSEEDDKIIQVKIIHEDGFFLIRVSDFGRGIQKENKLNKHKSYGIDILKSRVKIYNGNEYQESDVIIRSTSEGTTVTIKLKEWTQ